MGFVGPYSGAAVLPIGHSIYILEIEDDQQISIVNAEKKLCGPVNTTMLEDSTFGTNRTTKWRIEKYRLEALFERTGGASGRNFSTSIKIGKRSAESLISSETMGGSDLPLLVALDDKGHSKNEMFGASSLLIVDLENEVLIVKACRLSVEPEGLAIPPLRPAR